MKLLVGAYIAAVYLLAAASCERLVFEDTQLNDRKFRVIPIKYETYLKFNSLDSGDYEGRVDILLKLTHVPRWFSKWVPHYAEDEIVLHANRTLEIQQIKVTDRRFFGRISREHKIKRLSRDQKKEMIVIQLKSKLKAHRKAKISISFLGKMRKDMRGVYVSQYNDGSRVHKHIVSQFQPTDARTVFPCFDDPQFKVPFQLTLEHPSGLTAYGNTQGHQEKKRSRSLATTKFEQSPPMPVHMVAFTVGHFDEPLETEVAPTSKRGKPVKVRVITAPGKREAGHFALQTARDSLRWFERYIDYPFPLDKLDVIAIADHDKDNTESWGLVFVRDTLLWIDEETKPDTRITTAVNVAHVVVHQWFGNLISAAEWEDLWITEGVAAQFAFKFVEELYPAQSEFFVRLSILKAVMQADQPGTLHAISPPRWKLLSSDEIYGIFDNLEFMKSASFAQMVLEHRGASKYQDSLRQLVARHANGLVSRRDYANMIDRVPLLPLSFIHIVGVPLLSININEKAIEISNEFFPKSTKFLNDYSPSIYTNARFAMSNSTPDKDESISVDSLETSIRLPDWFKNNTVNDQKFFKLSVKPTISSYYRTHYSDELFARLINAVRHKWLGPMDRIQLLDDANNFVKANLIGRDSFANLLVAYTDETDSAVLIELLAVNKTLASLGLQSPLHETFMDVFQAHKFEVTGEETLLEQRARQVILKALVDGGDESVTAAALQAFERQGRKSVALFLREPVYAAVVQAGSSEQLHSLLEKLDETRSYEEKIRLLTALASSKDKAVLARVRSWLAGSGLKAETVRPFEDSIAANLAN